MALTKIPSELSSTTGIVDNSNATAITIDSSENVGIGITSSLEKFTVANASSGIVGRFTNNTNQTLDLGVISGSGAAGGVYYNSANSGYHAFQVGGTERMRIDSSGNVGIGTSSPSATDWGSANQVLQISGTQPLLSLKDTDTGEFQIANSGQNLYFWDSVANSNRMLIDSSGNVGIGTTSPNSKLDTGGDYYSGTATTVAQLTNKISTYSTLSQGSLYGFGQDSYGLHMTAGQAGQSLMFHTGGSAERVRIDGSGNLLVGTTSTMAAGVDGIQLYQSIGQIGTARNSTGGANHHVFFNPNGLVGAISTSGSSTVYGTSSDYRLKENVVELTGATERLKQLNPSRFNFIADADTTVDGFLAHEVADVVPEAVLGEKDAMKDEEYEVTPAVLDEEGNVVTEAVIGTRSVPEYQGIDQSKLVPLLVATIQELEARITELENN